jgi:hypothetical protein
MGPLAARFRSLCAVRASLDVSPRTLLILTGEGSMVEHGIDHVCPFPHRKPVGTCGHRMSWSPDSGHEPMTAFMFSTRVWDLENLVVGEPPLSRVVARPEAARTGGCA